MESVETPRSPEEKARWRQNERHGSLLASRLTRLVERGYRPIFEGEADLFDLSHPNPQATPIQLWPDGQVVDRFPTMVKDGERTIIYPEDEHLFARFLTTVPRPNPLRKVLGMRVGEVLSTTASYGVLFLIIWGAGAILRSIWRAIFGH